jgi:hypothetical protein
MLNGSGTGVALRSSMVKEVPPRSPVITIFEIPVLQAKFKNSSGLEPGSPDKARLEEKADVTVPSRLLRESKKDKVNGAK